jgi:hypothetical protein
MRCGLARFDWRDSPRLAGEQRVEERELEHAPALPLQLPDTAAPDVVERVRARFALSLAARGSAIARGRLTPE